MFPFTRVPFWVPSFDPQPCGPQINQPRFSSRGVLFPGFSRIAKLGLGHMESALLEPSNSGLGHMESTLLEPSNSGFLGEPPKNLNGFVCVCVF